MSTSIVSELISVFKQQLTLREADEDMLAQRYLDFRRLALGEWAAPIGGDFLCEKVCYKNLSRWGRVSQ
jgi:hypothetical protein